MKKWEYTTLAKWSKNTSDILVEWTVDDFCELGLQGWEAISVVRDMAYFKRPIEKSITFSHTERVWKK